MTAAVLYMLATPIGNLQDISLRALDCLRAATVIAAEDTRVARRLLSALAIPAPPRLLSLRAHNEQQASLKVIRALQDGESVVYVSDAGTPAISDPGAKLVQAVRAAGFAISPLPGASALTAFLAVAGLPDVPLHFYGFPPPSASKRRKFFSSLCTSAGSGGYTIFYEAPHRISAMIADLAAVFGGEQRIVIGRELTKRHEQIIDDSLAAVAAAFAAEEIAARGEFVIAVENPAKNTAAASAAAEGWRVFCHLSPLLPPRQAAAAAAKISGANAAELYRRHSSGTAGSSD